MIGSPDIGPVMDQSQIDERRTVALIAQVVQPLTKQEFVGRISLRNCNSVISEILGKASNEMREHRWQVVLFRVFKVSLYLDM